MIDSVVASVKSFFGGLMLNPVTIVVGRHVPRVCPCRIVPIALLGEMHYTAVIALMAVSVLNVGMAIALDAIQFSIALAVMVFFVWSAPTKGRLRMLFIVDLVGRNMTRQVLKVMMKTMKCDGKRWKAGRLCASPEKTKSCSLATVVYLL
jgi:hypothetical protein